MALQFETLFAMYEGIVLGVCYRGCQILQPLKSRYLPLPLHIILLHIGHIIGIFLGLATPLSYGNTWH